MSSSAGDVLSIVGHNSSSSYDGDSLTLPERERESASNRRGCKNIVYERELAAFLSIVAIRPGLKFPSFDNDCSLLG
jgi:hypothetical protein